MSTTVTQPFFVSPGAKTESGEDAGGKRYIDTARPEDEARRRFAAQDSSQPDRSPSGRGHLTLGKENDDPVM